MVNSFPDPEQQEQWLAKTLDSELTAKKENHVINMVRERARVDANYFNCLLSMTRNRWSGYRQTVLNVARDLVGTSKGRSAQRATEELDETTNEKAQIKSAYGLSGSNAEKATAAAELLDHEAFHYGRTSADVLDNTAPYQRREMFIMLAYFFKNDSSLKDQVPIGEHGPEIPKAMVALAATSVEVALREVAEGGRQRFSEEKQQDRYNGYINTFEEVRRSEKGDLKLARLLSNIYKGTMKETSTKRSDRRRTPAMVTARPSLMNTDLMPT